MIRPLFVLLTGVAAGELIGAALFWRLGLCFLSVICMTAVILVKKNIAREYVFCITFGCVFGFIIFLFASRIDYYEMVIAQEEKEGILQGKIVEIKEKEGEDKLTILIDDTTFQSGTEMVKLRKKIYVYADIDTKNQLYPGDTIKCIGILSLPEEPTNPGQFNQKIYCRANGVYYLFFAERYERTKRPMHSVRRAAYKMKKQIEEIYAFVFREEQAALLDAMVLGDKTKLTDDTKKIYEENGVMALLCVSGLHVSIIAGRIYQRLRKRKCNYLISCIISAIVLLFYGCMTGFGSSVMRAVLMFLVYLGAEYYGTYYDILSSMSLAAILMLVEHPYRILEGGFLISYLSILSIGIVIPPLQDLLQKRSGQRKGEDGILEMSGVKKKIKEGIIFSVTIYFVTAPMIMRFYYECTPYCVLLNPLVIPFMSILMFSAIGIGILGMILNGFFGNFLTYLPVQCILAAIGFPASFLLESYEKIFIFTRKLPFSLLITGCPSVTLLIGMYLVEAIFLYCICYEKKKAAGYLALFAILVMLLRPEEKFQITMLDIGQGDCILVHTAEGKNILIDGGSTSEKNIYSYVLKPALYYYGISKLDMVVVSHMDEDHISGIRELLEDQYPVGFFITDDGSFERESYPSVHQMVRIKRGDQITLGKLKMTCLHPEANFVSEDENAKSIVLYVEYEDFTALFTGDLGTEQEETLVEQADQKHQHLTLLKVGHHGSKYSTGEELLETYKPIYAIISAGKNNRYHHPHPETIERLENANVQIWQTKEGGAIIVKKKGEKWGCDYYH